MSNALANRLGQVNLAGDPDALFLKIFSGMVQEAYDRALNYRDKILVKNIPYGKSAQFPTTGQAAVRYHTPGSEILGGTIPLAEKIILLDDMLISDIFIASIDEMKNHYDVRANFANQMGQALARFVDMNISRTITNAARTATPTITGGNAGSYTEDADLATDGQKVWSAAYNAVTGLDVKDIPSGDRFIMFDPTRYALAVRSEKPINVDINPGGNGSLAQGVLYYINGVPVFKTNNMAQADDRANTQMPASRQVDYSPTVGQVWHRGAAGMLELLGRTMEMERDIRRQGTLLVGKQVHGHGDLRPEGAWELRTAAPS